MEKERDLFFYSSTVNFPPQRLRIEARVEGVEVSGVQLLLKTAKSFSETLEVDDLTLP